MTTQASSFILVDQDSQDIADKRRVTTASGRVINRTPTNKTVPLTEVFSNTSAVPPEASVNWWWDCQLPGYTDPGMCTIVGH